MAGASFDGPISRSARVAAGVRGAAGVVVACLVVVLVSLATWSTRLDGPIDLRWDGGAYYILGTSLADGHGYRLLSEPGGIESSLHPPLLPFLVAACERVLGSSDPLEIGHVLRLMMLACSIAYAVATCILLSAYLPRAYALAASLIGVLLPQTVYFSDSFYAEPFFGLFSVLFFVFYRHRERHIPFLLAGLCAILAYEARSAGIALLAAWVIDNLIRKDFRRGLAALAVSLAVVLGWLGWIRTVESSPEYRHPAYAYQTAPYLYFNVSYARNMMTLQDPSAPELGPLTPQALAGRVWSNVLALPVVVGRAVSGWEAPNWLALPLALIVFAGAVVMARRRQFVMLLYVALSLAAVCSTPFQKQFVRYLLPLFPFFALALFEATLLLVARSRALRREKRGAIAATLPWLLVVVIALSEVSGLDDLYGKWHDPVSYLDANGATTNYRLFLYAPLGASLDEALDWLRTQPKKRGAVVAATDPQWVYLRTGMKAVLPPFEIDGVKAQRLVDTVPVEYLIVEKRPARLGLGAYQRFTSALLRDNPLAWGRLWSSSDGSTEIYQRKADAFLVEQPPK